MTIKFWTPRHRTYLYSLFDQVRVSQWAVLDKDVLRDILDQKITQKAYRRIQSEWAEYWNDVFEEEPSDKERLVVAHLNKNQVVLMLAKRAAAIGKTTEAQLPDLFAKANDSDEDEED